MLSFIKSPKRYVFKVYTLRALVLTFCAILLVSAGFVGLGGDASEVMLLANSRKIPIYCVDKSEKVVAFTFDAAYGGEQTERLMEVLQAHGVPATFFLVGFWVDKYPDLTKKLHDNGFEIGSHSNMHSHMSIMSSVDISQDLSLSVQKIEKITGKKVDLFRAPYGEYDNKLIVEAEKLGLNTIQWSVDSIDWKGISADEMTSRVVSRIHEGAIVLYHNNSDHVLEALPKIIQLLKTRGYTFTTVGNLIYRENYRIDATGKQIKNT